MNQSADSNTSRSVVGAAVPGADHPNMNIRRFVAENSRVALRQVRDALGGDAIILANRSIDGGVEVLAAAPEAVDALTSRMMARSAAPQPPATPTELGLKQPTPSLPTAGASSASTPANFGRKRLASFFGRRAQTPVTDDNAAADISPNSLVPPSAAVRPKASNPYASFADELAGAMEDDASALQLAPETVTLSRPIARIVAEPLADRAAAPVASSAPLMPIVPIVPASSASPEAVVRVAPEAAQEVPHQMPQEAAAAAAIAPSAVAAAIESIPAPVAPTFSTVELKEAVAREVSREFDREFGRDVINDLTRDVSREVSQAVTGEVVRDVTRNVTRDVTRELRAMQTTLSEQLSTISWTDAMRRQPARTKLMQDLILAGFSPSLSRHIQERLPEDSTPEAARQWAEAVLCRNLPVATEAEKLMDEGGVFALVGPTGVGKTTTVAKLAARFALKHGVDQLALITTDGFRIGAQDQLRIYGKILGVPVLSFHDEATLTTAISHLRNKKLVLIDTAGLSQRDEHVAEQIAMLRGAKARRLVVLNATADAETLDHVVETFADREFAGCVITKTDEAARLGPVLDAVIRHRLRIHHVSTGQKVPEDLERPDAPALVHQALTRQSVRSAFELKTDDAPVWMSAMVERAGSQSLPLDISPAAAAPLSPSAMSMGSFASSPFEGSVHA